MEFRGPAQYGLRRFGVPIGGFFDRGSAMAANALVGRASGAQLLELTMASFRFRTSAPLTFSVVGAPSEVRIDGRSVGRTGLYFAEAESEVSIEAPSVGARVYVSARFPHRFGAAFRVRKGDVLEIEAGEKPARELRPAENFSGESAALRVVAGPQAAIFPEVLLDRRLFTASTDSNRVGIRMEETCYPHQIELPSEPAGFGAIQITPAGVPIVLGPDGPTIGGYPKIAYVVSADLDLLGQLRPGAQLSFATIKLEDARELAHEHERLLRKRNGELSFATQLL